MNEKDAAVIKALIELGLRQPTQLTPEQEQQLELALDKDAKFLYDVEQLFKNDGVV